MIKKLLPLCGYIILVCLSTAIADDYSEPGDLKYICGLKNAEDILPLGDTQWMIASGLNGQFSNTNDIGHIYLVNRKNRTFEEFYPGEKPKFNYDKKMFNACPGPINPENFSAHGLALKQQSQGQFRLYITSHGEREAIEVFDINTKGAKPTIIWTGCVLLPGTMLANSVAILSDGGFVSTKFYDPTVPDSFNEIFQGKKTGAVYEWHPGGDVQAIEGSEISGANGIAVSTDNKWVYVAATGTNEIIRFNRWEHPVKLEKRQIGILPDNIRWGDDGLLYTAGDNHPECCDNPPCQPGWSVFSINPETLELKKIKGFDQTTAIQHASSAILIDNEIWIGTYAGDRIGCLPKP